MISWYDMGLFSSALLGTFIFQFSAIFLNYFFDNFFSVCPSLSLSLCLCIFLLPSLHPSIHLSVPLPFPPFLLNWCYSVVRSLELVLQLSYLFYPFCIPLSFWSVSQEIILNFLFRTFHFLIFLVVILIYKSSFFVVVFWIFLYL